MVVELPPLAILVFWVGALIFCLLCLYITKALFKAGSSTFGWIPGVGGWIKGELHTIEQRIVHVMSEAVAKCDAEIGASWHRLARLVDWLGREINAHANLIALLSQVIPGLTPIAMVQTWIREVRALIHAAQSLPHTLAQRIVQLEHRLTHGIGEDVLPRIRSLDKRLEHVITRDIPGIRTADRTLTRDLESLRTWVHRHTLEAGTLAFAGAVAVALGRLNLGWLRCNSLGNIGRKLGCGGFGLLETLLGDAFEAFIVSDLCDFIALMSRAAEEFAPLLIAFVDVEDVLIGCNGATKPLPLGLPPLDLPPVTAGLLLAA